MSSHILGSGPYSGYAVPKSAYLYNVLDVFIYFMYFAITSKGTIMEKRSTRSLNAIHATLIRVVFKFYFNINFKIYCKYFIYLFYF